MIGNRQVQVEDKKMLHFTNAVIHETQRMANIAPISLPHKTDKDVTFQGHFIKKVRFVQLLPVNLVKGFVDFNKNSVQSLQCAHDIKQILQHFSANCHIFW